MIFTVTCLFTKLTGLCVCLLSRLQIPTRAKTSEKMFEKVPRLTQLKQVRNPSRRSSSGAWIRYSWRIKGPLTVACLQLFPNTHITAVSNAFWRKLPCWSETSRSFAVRSSKESVCPVISFHLLHKQNWLLNISCRTDPLVHHGRHFGRTVHALTNVAALLNNGLLYMSELSEQPDETFSHEYVASLSLNI